MGEVINLNRFRKAKRHGAETRKAKENRVRHGLTGAERERAQRQKALEDKRHNGALVHLLPPAAPAGKTESSEDK